MSRKSLLFVALALVAAPVFAGEKTAEGPSVDEVVSRNLAAMGGAERMKALRSVTTAGTETFDGKASQFASTRARPNLFRYEVTEGKSVAVKAFDGSAGWHSADGKVEAFDAEKVAMMRTKSQFDDVLVDPAAKGAKLVLDGAVQVNGAKAYALLITFPDGGLQKRLIDAKTWLEVKRVTQWTYNGEVTRKVAVFKDWKTVSGIMTAMTTEYERDGKKGVQVLSRVEYDAPVEMALFAMPSAAPVVKTQTASK